MALIIINVKLNKLSRAYYNWGIIQCHSNLKWGSPKKLC